jgi:hypothetical protein
MKRNDIRNLIITGSYLIGDDGKEPVNGWKDYANRLEEVLIQNNGVLCAMPIRVVKNEKIKIMSREIKFRYRYTDGRNWLMPIFTLDEIINGHPFTVLDDSPLLKNYKHVGQDQWTGLTDYQGTPIFEGDIIHSLDSQDKPIMHCIVFNEKEARFGALWITDISEDLNSPGGITKAWIEEFDKKVIGNIYQNPIKSV